MLLIQYSLLALPTHCQFSLHFLIVKVETTIIWKSNEFLQIHGSPLSFTQQGLEKYNDVVTKTYFRCTSSAGSFSKEMPV